MNLSDLATPAVIIDYPRLRRNINRCTSRAADLNVRLRSHVKTHKCVEIAQMQTPGSFKGLTVSTLAEAEAFFSAGFGDLIYGVPIEPGKFERVFDFIRRGARLAVITDSEEIPEQLSTAATRAGVDVEVHLKVDCGYHRCGVGPASAAALNISRELADSPSLKFGGILTHAGHSYHARSREELIDIARAERDIMVEFAGRLRSDGIEVPSVSIGSTPTMSVYENLAGIDEVRPGNYVFYDAFQATLGSCRFDDCVLTVLASVVHCEDKKMIVDAGGIALSKDRGPVEFDSGCGYGRVYSTEGEDLHLRLTSLSQEHGVIESESGSLRSRFKLGSRIRILANHSCMAAAQHRYYHVLEDNRIVAKWEAHHGW